MCTLCMQFIKVFIQWIFKRCNSLSLHNQFETVHTQRVFFFSLMVKKPIRVHENNDDFENRHHRRADPQTKSAAYVAWNKNIKSMKSLTRHGHARVLGGGLRGDIFPPESLLHKGTRAQSTVPLCNNDSGGNISPLNPPPNARACPCLSLTNIKLFVVYLEDSKLCRLALRLSYEFEMIESKLEFQQDLTWNEMKFEQYLSTYSRVHLKEFSFCEMYKMQ
jgi:hypothetical protein